MLRKLFTASLLILLASACSVEDRANEPALPSTEAGSAPPASAFAPASGEARPLPNDKGQFFAASGACAACHTGLTDNAGMDVSIDTAWRATMMANSARDPYWQAGVRSEVLAYPEYREAIEDECNTCHTPMASITSAGRGELARLLDGGYGAADNPLHGLAMDGVSCNVCHQIQPDNLGTPESFSGAFVIDLSLPQGERPAFGRFPVTEAMARVMQASSGFVPQQSPHLAESTLCASCHTLYTHHITSSGQVGAAFPEQVVYLEWLNSDFRETGSCQSCHMPVAQGDVRLASMSPEPQSPFHQHGTVGGNAYMLQVLDTFGDELEVTATSAQLDHTAALAAAQISGQTAQVRIENARLGPDRLEADVVIANLAGHKFPSSYPSRRAWVHFKVRDAQGGLVFESGAWSADGSIAGNDNDADAARFEPHYTTISSPEQVQIYEAIMANDQGQVTTTLLAAARHIKDNRLLPRGFDKLAAEPDYAVVGEALEDADFTGGEDVLHFSLPLNGVQGPLTVEVEILYQTIAYRWMANLARHSAFETERMQRYYNAVPNAPLVAAAASLEVGK